MAIVMVSSELPEILGMSDRILVMREGTVAGILEREDGDAEKIMTLATVGARARDGRQVRRGGAMIECGIRIYSHRPSGSNKRQASLDMISERIRWFLRCSPSGSYCR